MQVSVLDPALGPRAARTREPGSGERTISGEMRRIGFTTVGVSVGIVSLILIISAAWLAAADLRRSAEVRGEALAQYIAPALVFDDRAAADSYLRGLGDAPEIRAATLFDGVGQVFSAYGVRGAEPLPAPPAQTLSHWSIDRLRVDVPVGIDGDVLGSLTLEVGMSGIYRNIGLLGVALLLASAVAVLFGSLLSQRLSANISSPLMRFRELLVGAPTGEDFSIRAEGSPIRELDALALGFNSMMSQIELRDSQLAQHQQHLQQEVDNRTRDLLLAKEAAESASQAKSAFLATMSHEIRTPLHGALGAIEILLQQGLAERERAFAESALRSNRHLLDLLNDLLDFSKIEAGKLELNEEPFCVREILRDAVTTHEAVAQRKGIELGLECDERLPERLLGDSLRIRQILINLVGNAVKFTDQGSVRLSAMPSRREGESGIVLRITDTGPGIDAAARAHIFDTFSQADNSTSRRYGGTGLGLAICQRLAQQMGGRINLSSVVGKGSTFAVELPLVAAEAGEARAAPATPEALKPLRGRVLLAEDNEVNQMVAGEVLDSIGVEYEIANDGIEAVAKVRSGTFDVVLMDCHMPMTDGFDATRQIREWEAEMHRGPVPVIALTADAQEGSPRQCREAGMNGYLSKPFGRDDLHQQLAAHLPSAS